jgi:hypothetical protein
MPDIHGTEEGERQLPPGYEGPTARYRYLQFEQGMFAVRSNVIARELHIRECVCGIPIFLQGVSRKDTSALNKGQVVGFMLWNDIKGTHTDGRLYSYCQIVDPFIDAGWTVAAETAAGKMVAAEMNDMRGLRRRGRPQEYSVPD